MATGANRANIFQSDLEDRFADAESRATFELEVAKIKSLGELLRSLEEAREQQHITKKEVAERINRKPSAISRLLSGGSQNLTFFTLADLAYALDLELSIRIRRRPKRTKRPHEPVHVDALV